MTEHPKSGRIACFGLSPVAKIIASFVMGISGNKNYRFFKTEEEASAKHANEHVTAVLNGVTIAALPIAILSIIFTLVLITRPGQWRQKRIPFAHVARNSNSPQWSDLAKSPDI
jgi:hypothetical protein